MNIYEVAKKAGVSIATVSRVLNNNPNVRKTTKEKVEAVLREMNYTPNAIARSLVTNSTKTIGVLAADVRDSYYASALYTLEQEFQKLGYHVILCNTGGELEKKKLYLRVLIEKKVEGMVLVGSVFKEKISNHHILDTARYMPIVMLNSHLEGENIYSIVCEDGYATSGIVDILYRKGHRHIAYVYDVESFSGMAKLDGFKRGMNNNGLDVREKGILQVQPGLQGGVEAVSRLDKSGCPYTAVVTSEDSIAAGVLKALKKAGKKVPEDAAVFGFNNSEISRCTTPELSTVDNKVEVLASGAVRILHEVLQSKDVAARATVTPEIILRESS